MSVLNAARVLLALACVLLYHAADVTAAVTIQIYGPSKIGTCVNLVLHADVRGVDDGASVAYQWMANLAPINLPSSTTSTLIMNSDDLHDNPIGLAHVLTLQVRTLHNGELTTTENTHIVHKTKAHIPVLTLSTPPWVTRADDLTIFPDVHIPTCNLHHSYLFTFAWTVTPPLPPGSDMSQWGRAELDKRVLFVPRATLDSGVTYKFTFKVDVSVATAEDQRELLSSHTATTLVEVRSSPVHAAIDGPGSFRVSSHDAHGNAFVLSLDGSVSHDPDMTEVSRYTRDQSLKYEWTCCVPEGPTVCADICNMRGNGVVTNTPILHWAAPQTTTGTLTEGAVTKPLPVGTYRFTLKVTSLFDSSLYHAHDVAGMIARSTPRSNSVKVHVEVKDVADSLLKVHVEHLDPAMGASRSVNAHEEIHLYARVRPFDYAYHALTDPPNNIQPPLEDNLAAEARVHYVWEVWVVDEKDSSIRQLTLIPGTTLLSTPQTQTLSLAANTFAPGESVTVALRISDREHDPQSADAHASVYFEVNSLPFGGTCGVHENEVKNWDKPWLIHCEDWRAPNGAKLHYTYKYFASISGLGNAEQPGNAPEVLMPHDPRMSMLVDKNPVPYAYVYLPRGAEKSGEMPAGTLVVVFVSTDAGATVGVPVFVNVAPQSRFVSDAVSGQIMCEIRKAEIDFHAFAELQDTRQAVQLITASSTLLQPETLFDLNGVQFSSGHYSVPTRTVECEHSIPTTFHVLRNEFWSNAVNSLLKLVRSACPEIKQANRLPEYGVNRACQSDDQAEHFIEALLHVFRHQWEYADWMSNAVEIEALEVVKAVLVQASERGLHMLRIKTMETLAWLMTEVSCDLVENHMYMSYVLTELHHYIFVQALQGSLPNEGMLNLFTPYMQVRGVRVSVAPSMGYEFARDDLRFSFNAKQLQEVSTDIADIVIGRYGLSMRRCMVDQRRIEHGVQGNPVGDIVSMRLYSHGAYHNYLPAFQENERFTFLLPIDKSNENRIKGVGGACAGESHHCAWWNIANREWVTKSNDDKHINGCRTDPTLLRSGVDQNLFAKCTCDFPGEFGVMLHKVATPDCEEESQVTKDLFNVLGVVHVLMMMLPVWGVLRLMWPYEDKVVTVPKDVIAVNAIILCTLMLRAISSFRLGGDFPSGNDFGTALVFTLPHLFIRFVYTAIVYHWASLFHISIFELNPRALNVARPVFVLSTVITCLVCLILMISIALPEEFKSPKDVALTASLTSFLLNFACGTVFLIFYVVDGKTLLENKRKQWQTANAQRKAGNAQQATMDASKEITKQERAAGSDPEDDYTTLVIGSRSLARFKWTPAVRMTSVGVALLLAYAFEGFFWVVSSSMLHSHQDASFAVNGATIFLFICDIIIMAVVLVMYMQVITSLLLDGERLPSDLDSARQHEPSLAAANLFDSDTSKVVMGLTIADADGSRPTVVMEDGELAPRSVVDADDAGAAAMRQKGDVELQER